MSKLRVRAYNVRFGDAILVTVPDRGPEGNEQLRHILIDVGNVLSGSGGQDQIFEHVVEDIQNELGDKPVDLYVMTHEHMDHCQGLFWAKKQRGLDLRAEHVWLTASAAKDYYDRFEDAKRKLDLARNVYEQIERYVAAAPTAAGHSLKAMLNNNNPRSTGDCVDHLRTIGQDHYVSRQTDLAGKHGFHEARFSIWGPEEDTSIYYGRFKPMGLGAGTALGEAGVGDGSTVGSGPLPPAGVDAGAFYNLVERRRRGVFDNLLAIDKAANNTSLVFMLSWRGWKLLFCGDAEERAWKEMHKRELLEEVHFLKVGHHGSHNGTPDGQLLDAILPMNGSDGRKRTALISTHEGTYNDVPDAETVAVLKERCDEVVRIGESNDQRFVDLWFEDVGR